MAMIERWLPVVGFEGKYEVSDQGRVYSIPRNRSKGGLLRPNTAGKYPSVMLTDGPLRRTFPLHSLVLETFAGPRPEGMEVRHKDGNAVNPALSNLMWGTRVENEQDKIRHGTGGLRTHCRRGHELTPDNVIAQKSGRTCRQCKYASIAAWQETHPEQVREISRLRQRRLRAKWKEQAQ